MNDDMYNEAMLEKLRIKSKLVREQSALERERRKQEISPESKPKLFVDFLDMHKDEEKPPQVRESVWRGFLHAKAKQEFAKYKRAEKRKTYAST